MTPTSATELYDPLVNTPREDVYEVYARLRDEHPFYHCKARDIWCLSRYEDVRSVARNWEVFGNEPGVDVDSPNWMGPGDFIDADPPRHDELRAVARPFFIPKKIAKLEEGVAKKVSNIIEDLEANENPDLSRDFARRLPIWSITHLLGAPEADSDMVHRLVMDAVIRNSGDDTMPEVASAAQAALADYLRNLAEEKRRHPDDGIMSAMVAGEGTGTPEPEEVIGMATAFYVAGTETTFALLGNSLKLLADNPSSQEAFRKDPAGLIDALIEESVRWDAPVQHLARTVRQPTELHGVELQPGDRILLIFAAANHDEGRWSDPDRFDIERESLRHLGFGEGIHFCIGAPLARLQARIALTAFFEAFSGYEIVEGERLMSHIIRAWDRLDANLVKRR